MPLVRMKAAPVKTDGERLGNEFMNGVFFSTHMGIEQVCDGDWKSSGYYNFYLTLHNSM